MRPEEARELLPLYALHALPDVEHAELERALEQYPELWPELKALQETAADLREVLPTGVPDADLKAKVMARVREGKAQTPVLPLPQKVQEPRTMSLPSRPRALWPRWAAGIAAVLLIAWGGAQLRPQLEWYQASRNPQAKVETLVDENKRPIGRAIFMPDGRCLVWTDLPPPPPGKTYQLWGVNSTDHLGLDTYKGGLIAFKMPEGYPTVHITEEKEGGSQTPSQIRALPEGN